MFFQIGSAGITFLRIMPRVRYDIGMWGMRGVWMCVVGFLVLTPTVIFAQLITSNCNGQSFTYDAATQRLNKPWWGGSCRVVNLVTVDYRQPRNFGVHGGGVPTGGGVIFTTRAAGRRVFTPSDPYQIWADNLYEKQIIRAAADTLAAATRRAMEDEEGQRFRTLLEKGRIAKEKLDRLNTEMLLDGIRVAAAEKARINAELWAKSQAEWVRSEHARQGEIRQCELSFYPKSCPANLRELVIYYLCRENASTNNTRENNLMAERRADAAYACFNAVNRVNGCSYTEEEQYECVLRGREVE